MRRNSGECVEVEAFLFTPDGKVDLYSHCGNKYGDSSELHRATYDPDIQLVHPGGPSYMKDSKSAHHRETCISMLFVALLNIAEK